MEHSENLVIACNLFKIITTILFVLGERLAAKTLILFIQPLRLMFYYNPRSMLNQPREVEMTAGTGMKNEINLQYEASANLRKCYHEIQQTFVMFAAVILVMSSRYYRPSKWLKKLYSWCSDTLDSIFAFVRL